MKAAARGHRPGAARRRRRLRRLRLGAGLPRGPTRQLPLVVHEGNALPGHRQQARRPVHHARRDQLPRHRPAARALHRAADPADDLHPRPGRAARRGAGAPSGSTPTGRRCWSPAAPRAPGGSTSPSPAAARAFAAAGVQVLHVVGPEGEADRGAARPASRRTSCAVRRPDGPRLRRRRRSSSAAPGPTPSPRSPAVGLPAVFVPLPIGNGEQALNARPVVDAGGGLLVADAALTAEWVAATVPDLLTDPARLAAMSAAAVGPDPARRRREAGRDGRSRPREGAPMRVPVPDVLLPADRLGRVHFVGIGGAGLSGIARIMLARGISGQRQRRQGVPRPRGAAGARRHLLRRPRRRPRRATPTRWSSPPPCARTTPRSSRRRAAACGCCPARPRSSR